MSRLPVLSPALFPELLMDFAEGHPGSELRVLHLS